ncbi:MAG: zinc-binding dehydrogenase [Candidatus Bathyarchaeota archaeon]|jgi:L-iditol 2-dehydrogenase
MVKASVLEDVGSLNIHDYPRPEVDKAAMLLQMELCGVCGTDIHLYGGKMSIPFPVIPGHEFVGKIQELDESARNLEAKGEPLIEGDLVVVVPGTNAFCGTCYFCRFMPHKPTYCTNRRVMGVNLTSKEPPHLLGGWAEEIYVDATHYWTYKVLEGVPPEIAVLVEPMAVSSRALERAYSPGVPTSGEGFGPGDSVVVQGAGPIGLLAVASAKVTGAGKIVSIDMVDDRLEMAKKIGADHIIDMRNIGSSEERIEEVRRLIHGLGADVVIECAGVPRAVPEGVGMTRRGGRFVEVGHYTNPGDVEINPHMICMKDMDILGSWAYPPTQFDTALQLLKRGMENLPLAEIITHKFHIADAEKSIETVKSGIGIKMAIIP